MTDSDYQHAIRRLLDWYDTNRRILPWRENPTPYRVLVSEIMLQQTRVETVKPYFERFVDELPDFYALAAVDTDRLMKLWQGLGYYRRAANLRRAAIRVVSEFGGDIPPDYDAIRSLCGVGEYTAGAIAAFAFNLPVPAVDGNVIRVVARLTADGELLSTDRARKRCTDFLADKIPTDRAGDFGQALIELGATHCTFSTPPDCRTCPLSEVCLGYAGGSGNPADFPPKQPKKERKNEKITVLRIVDGDRLCLRRRGDRGVLAGLWEPPTVAGWIDGESALRAAADFGFEPVRIRPLEPAIHRFTHIEWRMQGYEILVAPVDDSRLSPGFRFRTASEIAERNSIPTAFAPYCGDFMR